MKSEHTVLFESTDTRHENNTMLDSHLPRFSVKSENISILESPTAFYEEILHMVSSAKKRLVLASLYFSNETEIEKALLTAIEAQLYRESALEVTIVLDKNRMQRSGLDFHTSLTNMKKLYPKRIFYALFELPSSVGQISATLDRRIAEFLGVFHMKVYIADNKCMWSGANLSEQYFTTRTDRWLVISESPNLCDYCTSVTKHMELISFASSLSSQCSRSTRLLKDIKSLKYIFFRREPPAMVRLRESLALLSKRTATDTICNYDTVIVPFLQYGPGACCTDESIVSCLVESFRDDASVCICIASAYCNFTECIKRSLLAPGQCCVKVISSGLSSNSFNGGKGITHLVPYLYRHLFQRFYRYIHQLSADHRVSLWSWNKKACSFHAKGLWVLQDHQLDGAGALIKVQKRCPVMIIGSSNLGCRSACRDLEMSALVVTKCQILQTQMSKECQTLFMNSEALQKSKSEVNLSCKYISALVCEFVLMLLSSVMHSFL